MTSPEIILESFNEAFNRRDVDGVMALMTEDCVFENTYPAPDGERFEGQAAVRGFWEDMFGSTLVVRFDTEDLIVAADRAVQRWTYNWVDPQGIAGHVRGVDVFRLRDGKVAEKLSYVKG